ncbi:MAG: polysaccharide biosynthesis tyrosine autokinase [Thermoleophilaceae bacterium]
MNGDIMAPRYTSLRDYLRVVRQRRALILALTLLFGLGGLVLGLSQHNKYRAQAALRFTDPSAAINEISQTSVPRVDLPTLAIQSAVDVEGKTIASATRKAVGKTAAVSVNVFDEPRTNLVDIEISSTDRRAAARWANTWAEQAAKITNRRARADFQRAAKALLASTKNLSKSAADQATKAALAQRAATLQAAARIVAPARVVRRAEVPSSPYTPDRLRDALVGLLIGLTLGLLAAFVRDAVDRRVRRPVEIESDLHVPVLGYIQSGAMRAAPFTVNGAKRRRGLLPPGRRRLDEAALEGFQILRTNLDAFEEGKVRTVMVTSALAGEGKSTVAVGLAGAAVLSGRRTLLVECDLRKPALAGRLGVEERPGLGDYLAGAAEPADVLRLVSLSAPDGGPGGGELVVIPAGGPREESARLLSSDRFAEFLDQIRSKYEVVVLDASPMLSVADPREIARHVDAVLLCVRAARTTREQARAAKAALDQVSARPSGVVVTDVSPGEDEIAGYYSYRYGA